jgi:hypothetical protein
VSVDHRALVDTLTDVMSRSYWPDLPKVFAPNAVLEFPQSGEVFRGLDNIRGQFEDYPAVFNGEVSAVDLAAEQPTFALSPNYTVISVGTSGTAATATLRARYPDGSMWWVVVVYDTEGARVRHAKVYFAPDFEPAEWRAKYRDSTAK